MATIEQAGPRIWVFSAPPNLVDVDYNDTRIEKMVNKNSEAAVITNGTFFNWQQEAAERDTFGVVQGRGRPSTHEDQTRKAVWTARYWLGITPGYVAEIGGPGLPANYKTKYAVFLSGAGRLLQAGKFPPGKYPDNVLGNFSKDEGYHNRAIRVALGLRTVNGKEEVVLYVADGKEKTQQHPPNELKQTLQTVGNALLKIGVTDAIWLDGSSALALAVNGQVKHHHQYDRGNNWILMYDE